MPTYTIFCDNIPNGRAFCQINASVTLIDALPDLFKQLRLCEANFGTVDPHGSTLFLFDEFIGKTTAKVDLTQSLHEQGVLDGASLYLAMPEANLSDDGAAPVPMTENQVSSHSFAQSNTSELPMTFSQSPGNKPQSILDGEEQSRTPAPIRPPSITTTSSSVRRRTCNSLGSTQTLRVQLDPETHIIEVPCMTSPEPLMIPSAKTMNGMVVQTLADIGSEFCPHLRPMLQYLASLILTRRPKDPEQCIIDHLDGKHLGDSQVASNDRFSHARRESDRMQEGAQGEVYDANSSASNETTSRKSGEHPHRQERATAPSLTSSFLSNGPKTVAERLASAAPPGPGRKFLLKLAKLLLDVKPRDSEEYLCTRLEGRCFSEEVVATNALMHSISGLLLAPPNDPTELMLLKGVPVDSPGYTVAVNALSLLFGKKPSNPINYLFDHFIHRCRSSTVHSGASSNRHHTEDDSASSVSHNLCCSYVENAEGEREVEPMSSAEHELCMSNFLKVIQSRCSQEGLTPPCSIDLRRLMSSSLGWGRDRQGGARNQSASTKEASTQTLLQFGIPRSQPREDTSGNKAEPRLINASVGSSPKGGVMSAFPVGAQSCGADKDTKQGSGTPFNPTFKPLGFTFGSDLPSEAVPSTQVKHSIASGKGATQERTTSPMQKTTSSSQGFTANLPQMSIPLEEQTRICAEFDQLRLRGELRQERLMHEIATLRREKEYRESIATIYDGASEKSAAQAAAEALYQAECHLKFLQDHDRTLREMMQRHLRAVSLATTAHAGSAQPSITPLHPFSLCHSLYPPYTATPAAQGFGLPRSSIRSDEFAATELEILKKCVELLALEQYRARGYAGGGDPEFGGVYS
ncbi:unnamed protein product [Phytomonas sp. EM1]|nr:unnamed protein product [Phytomonas sp. EM1]|eukprot:CCW62064.1 unnamed protein product [Phytomonas sp. isolate EM1]